MALATAEGPIRLTATIVGSKWKFGRKKAAKAISDKRGFLDTENATANMLIEEAAFTSKIERDQPLPLSLGHLLYPQDTNSYLSPKLEKFEPTAP